MSGYNVTISLTPEKLYRLVLSDAEFKVLDCIEAKKNQARSILRATWGIPKTRRINWTMIENGYSDGFFFDSPVLDKLLSK